MMKNVYSCPHCRSVLNPNIKILLAARYGRKRGMMLLSPQPGNFWFICDFELRSALKPGAMVSLSCPVCAEDLTSSTSKNLAELRLMAHGKTYKRVEFSRRYGEQATFIVDGDNVVTYGDDVELYDELNFFGV